MCRVSLLQIRDSIRDLEDNSEQSNWTMLTVLAQTLALHLFFPRTMAPTTARDISLTGPPELHHALASPD
jgi:hypothetical protein